MNTKLGIGTGVFAALMFAVACFGSYTPLLLLVGYVFLCESDEWLKKAGVKALVIMVCVDFFRAVINLVPDVLAWINNLLAFFNSNINYAPVSSFLTLITRALSIAEVVFLLMLAAKALKNETVKVPFVDGFIDKYIK